MGMPEVGMRSILMLFVSVVLFWVGVAWPCVFGDVEVESVDFEEEKKLEEEEEEKCEGEGDLEEVGELKKK